MHWEENAGAFSEVINRQVGFYPMLTAKPQLNLANAREYFREHLAVGDYYAEGQKVTGEWFGQGAEKLGLNGRVGERDFLALCDGLNPTTGGKLTVRQNSQRWENGRSVANRRVFYDFTLSPPKSVSVVALYQDDRILALHQKAVKTAMHELETFAETRVRKSGQRSERVTGNIVGASFQHDTSRELDPHLHTHCVVFNATRDGVEGRWKALEVQSMYRAQRFVENLYYHELAKGLQALGYEIENSPRDFEIKGVPASVIARFSKRHEQIDTETKNRISREGLKGDLNALRRQVAVSKRQRKQKESVASRLRPRWEKELSAAESRALAVLRSIHPIPAQRADMAAMVAWADEHLFERRSVVNDYELMAAALARGRGSAFDLPALRAAVEARGYLRENGTPKLTSREVLGDELAIVVAAHDGRGRHAVLNEGFRTSSALSAEQKTAVERIMASRDFITLFRGGAGTGKSFALKEVERGLSAASRPVVVLAPQRQQVSDLQKDGLPAETLSRFLVTKDMPAGAVVLLDEAGQVGGRQLRELVGIVKAHGGRLILSGDTRQHGAVAASDALRAIEKYGGLKPAVIRQIRRQDPKLGASATERRFIRRYRAAVKAAEKGQVGASFDQLDELGCIQGYGRAGRREALASEYLSAASRKERALVVAQTRDEVREVNEVIRQRLQAQGKLSADTRLVTYQPIDMGEAQKRDRRFYKAGQYACFLQRYGRYAKGELCEISGANDRGVVLIKAGRRSTLSYRYVNRLIVAGQVDMPIATGDRLQLKFNGKSVEGAPLNNGELVTVRRVRKNGVLLVEDDTGKHKTLTPSQRLFLRGYAVTSYASQGKTVDTVLLADAGNSGATNANQWYVTISRGRKRVVVFTSDKDALREQIRRAGERELALDLHTRAAPKLDANWRRHALAAIERTRLHSEVMQRVHGDQRRRIAV